MNLVRFWNSKMSKSLANLTSTDEKKEKTMLPAPLAT
jgi:cysteinyl-tRNA synthetase